ncbi:hypothetical protein [Rhizobacter sp. Root16D2]|uniref:hypothetical protein n=1 Tax=Rhizobacter sp. Root16D2 TaxID=1736479 RepID=UPI0006F312CF|nr:hypothetical protein [Rhizobacter sp. Root16D2]KRB03040.1 hypothetical protein ASE08_15895 [Rhizobacter sp. Root16D2]
MRRSRTSPPTGRAATGAALLEALIALLIVSLVSASMLNQQEALRQARTAARQRLDALQLARLAFDRLRAADASLPDIASPPPFKLTHGEASEADDAAAVRDLSVAVDWQGAAGGPRRVQLGSRVSGPSPLYDAVLGLAPQDIAIARPLGRAIAIPFESLAIAPGQSLWRPGTPGSPAWVFDDADGGIVAHCTGTPGACVAAGGSVLSGHLRFSASAPPDPSTPGDALLPLEVVLVLDGSPSRPVGCATQSIASAGARFMRYGCVVPDPPSAGWSGRVEIEPIGWRVGTQAGSQRVCRYSADLDGSGAIDRNDEHPARYTAVQGALSQQNHLLVRGDQPCPGLGAEGTHNDPLQTTVQHQP